MNEPAESQGANAPEPRSDANQAKPTTDQTTEAINETAGSSEANQFERLKPMPGHIGFTLVTSGFVLFEMLFVCMYSDKFWFGIDIRMLGIPAVIAALVLTHVLLRLQESPAGCNFFSLLWQQKPPIVYSQWVNINDPLFAPGIRFGNRHLVWSAIDEMQLSIWGNLIIKSRSLSGPVQTSAASPSWVVRRITQPDVVLKLPFGLASPEDQRKLVGLIRSHKPDVVLNQRLRKALGLEQSTEAKPSPAADSEKLRQATVYASLFGAVFLFVVLLDVGYSTFNYLQTLKFYYLCQVDARAGDLSKAQIDYNEAEEIRLHPLPISWVTNKLMTQEPVGPALFQAKADALWAMGKKDQAIEAATRASELAPKGFRHNLRLARMLTDVGKTKQAEEQIELAIENHKGNFLSALYMVALKQEHPPSVSSAAKAEYAKYRAIIDDEVFATADGPQWPPGGERFLHDIWYRDDVEYVFNRLIGPEPTRK
jgi:tetratricopeptide (TPR) repeat protein